MELVAALQRGCRCVCFLLYPPKKTHTHTLKQCLYPALGVTLPPLLWGGFEV